MALTPTKLAVTTPQKEFVKECHEVNSVKWLRNTLHDWAIEIELENSVQWWNNFMIYER